MIDPPLSIVIVVKKIVRMDLFWMFFDLEILVQGKAVDKLLLEKKLHLLSKIGFSFWM